MDGWANTTYGFNMRDCCVVLTVTANRLFLPVFSKTSHAVLFLCLTNSGTVVVSEQLQANPMLLQFGGPVVIKKTSKILIYREQHLLQH